MTIGTSQPQPDRSERVGAYGPESPWGRKGVVRSTSVSRAPPLPKVSPVVRMDLMRST